MIYPAILFFLGGVSLTLPIFCGYEISFLLLLWLLWRSNWRRGVLGGKYASNSLGPADDAFMSRVRQVLLPMHLGIAGMVVATLISALLAWILSPYESTLSATMNKWAHIVLKLGLLWYVVTTALVAAVRKGFKPRVIIWPLAGWMGVLAIYATVQRAIGIDWVHGLNAVLPENRHAYDVYRVSGLMGHPLSLAYNLMLIILWSASFCLDAWQRRKSEGVPFAGPALPWLSIGGFSLYILLISGSRFPLIILVVLALWSLRHQLWRLKYWLLFSSALLFGALWLERSFLSRFMEVLDPNVPLTQRFERLIFWQIHWRMFLENPIAGVGMAGYDSARLAFYAAIDHKDSLYTAHNIFLQVLADSGLCGMIGLLCFFVGFKRAANKSGRFSDNLALGLMLGGTMIAGLMQNNLRDSEYLYALWYLVAFGIVAVCGEVGERRRLGTP